MSLEHEEIKKSYGVEIFSEYIEIITLMMTIVLGFRPAVNTALIPLQSHPIPKGIQNRAYHVCAKDHPHTQSRIAKHHGAMSLINNVYSVHHRFITKRQMF